MTAYYNENDPFAAQWLRNLIIDGHIAHGDVDDRSIKDVVPLDLKGYTQCHFFAGIGGWSLALRMAGWPDDKPVWTGSCPCQPFSTAARGANTNEKDLWNDLREQINELRPASFFGEQVAKKPWADRVFDDLEALDYSVGAAVLPALSVGADHQRHRLYFAGYSNSHGKPKLPLDGEVARLPWTSRNPEPIPSEDGLPSRMGVLRAYGNAIVPQVAAEFILASGL